MHSVYNKPKHETKKSFPVSFFFYFNFEWQEKNILFNFNKVIFKVVFDILDSILLHFFFRQLSSFVVVPAGREVKYANKWVEYKRERK